MHNKARLLKITCVSKFIVIALIAAGGFLFADMAKAATLYIEPSAKKVGVGDLVTIRLLVDTQGKIINNADGIIQFPAGLAEVVSINYKNSIFSLWVEQPGFSNVLGTVSFNGGVPNPGYIGARGEVLSAVFRAKKAGTASFLFGSAAVRENDGLGTDILTSQLSASIDITSTVPAAENPIVTPIVTEQSLLSAPVIYSPVYTDQNSWYSAKAGVITWVLPPAVTAVQTLFNNNPNSEPSVNYAPPILQKEVKDLTDGVWYFHLRYSIGGKLSEITHYRIQIDNQQPADLNATSINNNDGTVSLSLKASDTLSGVDYYTIIIDNQPAIRVSAQSAKNPVLLPQLGIGSHQALIAVYDRAGNKKELTTQIAVGLLTAPSIDEYPQKISIGDRIEISGSSAYPKATIKIIVKPELGSEISYISITDENGKFSLVSDPVNSAGNYQLWAYIIGPDNANGPASKALSLTVEQSFWATTINKLAGIKIPYSSSAAAFIVIGLIIILITLFGWYKYFLLRKRFRLIEKRADDAFKFLLKRARKKILVLDKLQRENGSSSEEKKTLFELEETIEEIENLKKSETE